MNSDGHTRIAIGRIAKAFGIRGEMVVHPMTGDLGRFESLQSVFVGSSGATAAVCTVTGVRPGGSGVRISLAEVPDRTTAEKFAGRFLFVDEKDRITPPEGSFFVDEVVGLQVITDDGRVVGIVREVMHMPAQDVYVVASDGREIMIPAVREFILSIDPATQTMRVHLIDGMLE